METALAAVAQKGVMCPEVLKTRYISDPRVEANSRITNDRRAKCVAPRRANVSRRILYWWDRYPGIPILTPNRDVTGGARTNTRFGESDFVRGVSIR